MISCSVKLLTDYPEGIYIPLLPKISCINYVLTSFDISRPVLKECQDSWKAIVIDEFQDTSTMQYSLLKIIASHNHITIVGDDDQACSIPVLCYFSSMALILHS